MRRRNTHSPGLYLRGGIWHIDKQIKGYGRLCESTAESTLERAEQYLAHRIEEIRQAVIYGRRRRRTWREAATRYLEEHVGKATIATDAIHLEQLDPWIGDLALEHVHSGTLAPFVAARQAAGRKTKTINLALSLVRRILHLAARKWRDESGRTWIEAAPLIELAPVRDAAKPYPLDHAEQDRLIAALPAHLAEMALFAVNAGPREAEICGLRWEWELELEGLPGPVFLIPGSAVLVEATGKGVKSRRDRILVCNAIAARVIEARRAARDRAADARARAFVFHYGGRPLQRMNSTAWRRAWRAAGLPVEGHGHGPHQLRHTFGRRLRAAGVPKETRRILLGHAPAGDVTDHYSAPELLELCRAVQRIERLGSRNSPALQIVRAAAGGGRVT